MNIMKFIKKTKFFTLIELIVVIVVLGILAAIIIPNISSFQEEARETALHSDIHNIQTGIDIYMLKNNQLPLLEDATPQNPKLIDIKRLNPDYIRNLPKDKNLKFWLDFKGKIWASTSDSPSDIKIGLGKVIFSGIANSQTHNIYLLSSGAKVNSKADSPSHLEFLGEKTGVGELEFLSSKIKEDSIVLISTIDKYGLESAPVGESYSPNSPTENGELENKIEPFTPKTLGSILNVSSTPNDEISQSIAIGENVVWTSWVERISTNYKVALQRFDLSGNPIGNKIYVPTLTGYNGYVDMKVDENNILWVSWAGKSTLQSNHDVFLARYDNSGNKIGDTINVSNGSGYNGDVSLLIDKNRNVWISYHAGYGNSRIVLYNKDAQYIRSNSIGTGYSPRIALAGSESIWATFQTTSSLGEIYVQRFNLNGDKISPAIRLTNNSVADESPYLSRFKENKMVTIWKRGSSVYYQLFNLDGTLIGGETSTYYGYGYQEDLLLDNNDTLWRVSSGPDITINHLDETFKTTFGANISQQVGWEFNGKLAIDKENNMWVLWYGEPNGNKDVFLMKITK